MFFNGISVVEMIVLSHLDSFGYYMFHKLEVTTTRRVVCTFCVTTVSICTVKVFLCAEHKKDLSLMMIKSKCIICEHH